MIAQEKWAMTGVNKKSLLRSSFLEIGPGQTFHKPCVSIPHTQPKTARSLFAARTFDLIQGWNAARTSILSCQKRTGGGSCRTCTELQKGSFVARVHARHYKNTTRVKCNTIRCKQEPATQETCAPSRKSVTHRCRTWIKPWRQRADLAQDRSLMNAIACERSRCFPIVDAVAGVLHGRVVFVPARHRLRTDLQQIYNCASLWNSKFSA